jgi:DNA-binding transcriptional regulator YdaS (Cro superfamily)
MKLKQYLKKKDRAAFAAKIGTTKNYVNLLSCGLRRPGPELALKIEIETQGDVSRMELLYPGETLPQN